MEWTPFAEVAGVLAVTAIIAAVGLKLRQPLIISFLFAGILVGPSVLGLLDDPGELALFASIGISLLLFVVGLRLDLSMIRTVGPVALATGLGQVTFTSLVGLLIALSFGMEMVTALYVAVALTFSSTIIIVKLLSDKKEIDSLHGRIAVGFLIVQDIMAVLALIALTAFGGDTDRGLLHDSLWIFGKGFVMLGSIFVLMRWVLPPALNYLARSQEMLVLFAITWAVALSAGADMLGFSKEVGAFLAGISLASTHQRDAIGARLVVLRDFLLLFFFINLGAQLNIADLGAELAKSLVFSVFVLVGNPLIVMIIMGIMGYRKRTGFMCGLVVAQISEFSLILAALGFSLGHIDNSTMSLITLVGLITIFASTYMIQYSVPLYNRFSPLLGIFERKDAKREGDQDEHKPAHDHLVIMMGLGNYGSSIARRLKQHGWNLLAVDFDPEALQRARDMDIPYAYGDVTDPEVLAQLPIGRAQWVICTIRQWEMNLTLKKLLDEVDFQGRLAMAATDSADSKLYESLGAHLIMHPFIDAAEQAVEAITGAVQTLPALDDWPVQVRELALQPGSIFTGRTLRELNLRTSFGASVLAISRAGKIRFNPDPEFQMYPGDRLVLICPPEVADEVAQHLQQRDLGGPADEMANTFSAGQIEVTPDSPWIGQTLAQLDIRSRFGVAVIGIRRDTQKITSPTANDQIYAGDTIIVVGHTAGITDLRAETPQADSMRADEG